MCRMYQTNCGGQGLTNKTKGDDMELNTVKGSDGVWMCRGVYQGVTKFGCGYTKKEAEKEVMAKFGDWSVCN